MDGIVNVILYARHVENNKNCYIRVYVYEYNLHSWPIWILGFALILGLTTVPNCKDDKAVFSIFSYKHGSSSLDFKWLSQCDYSHAYGASAVAILTAFA